MTKINPGIYAKPFSNADPFLLADSRGNGWHFCLDKNGRGYHAERTGVWPIKDDPSDYVNCSIIMPYNLWVF